MKKYKLGDICEIVSGSTPKTNIAEFWDGDVKWITPAELDENTYIITDSVRKITNLAMQKTGLTAFPAGTVILSSRAPIGKVAIAGCKMCCNQGFKNFICSEIVNNKYLYWFLKHNTAYLNSLGRGATFKEISKSIVSSIEIDLPSLEEQKKVVDNIEKISTIITLRKKEISILDDLIKARFIELFGDPMTDVSKWSASTIGEQFNVSSGGTPATGEKAYWENGTIPWIGSNMCQDTMLSENDGKFITEEGYAHSSAKWFHKGTVLVALVGATIGKTALLRFDTTTNQNIAAIDVTQNAAFSSEFVFYHMQMLYSKFMEIGSGKFKMANQGFIRQLPLICPPIELQEQFAAFVEQTDKSKLLSGCRLFHSWAPENRDKPKHVGVPQRKTKVLRGGRRQQ